MQEFDQVNEQTIEKARVILAEADRVLIGAGAGFSAAAGLTYSGERFRRYFTSFIDRYDMTDMHSAGFYPFPTDADRWAYWAHHAWVNCLGVDATSLYQQLYTWAQSRDYFVITTNADKQFEKAGFEPHACLRLRVIMRIYSALEDATRKCTRTKQYFALLKKIRNG